MQPLAQRLKEQLKARHQILTAAFSQHNKKPEELLHDICHSVDVALIELWHTIKLPNDLSLIGVGGYGRGELFPYSDVDVLILLPRPADEALREKLAIYGAQVINIDMRSFAFSPSYMEAINEKVTQEQKRLVAENTLLTVEAEQKQKVAVAEAEASARRATADGEAYANLKVAQAQAEALRVQGASIQSNPGVLELRRIEVEMKKAETWNGVLPVNVYAGAPVPFFNATK